MKNLNENNEEKIKNILSVIDKITIIGMNVISTAKDEHELSDFFYLCCLE